MANPTELLVAGNPRRHARRRRGNPAEGEQATELYEQFHGRDSEYIEDRTEPLPVPGTLTELGDLVELRVKVRCGWKWRELNFKGLGVKVTSNAAGTQLYFIGGQQRLGRFGYFGADRTKDLVDLGAARYIAYRTRKSQIDNKNSTYEHFLGDETGSYPRLMYDKRGREPRLYLAGGEYRVEGVGIVN